MSEGRGAGPAVRAVERTAAGEGQGRLPESGAPFLGDGGRWRQTPVLTERFRPDGRRDLGTTVTRSRDRPALGQPGHVTGLCRSSVACNTDGFYEVGDLK